MQWQAVSAPQSAVSGNLSIHRFGYSDMMHYVFATGRLLELHMWNKWPFMGVCDVEMGRYAT